MDQADLPAPVVRALQQYAANTPAERAHLLRYEASRRISAALTSMSVGMWNHSIELLGLALGYLTAANRVDDEAKAA